MEKDIALKDKPIRNHSVMSNVQTISWYLQHQSAPMTAERVAQNKKEVAAVTSCWNFA